MKVEGKKLDFDRPVGELFTSFVGDERGPAKPIPQYKGEIGLEIEVEGRNLPHNILSYWRCDKDGSLRGGDNAEYILRQPCQRRSTRKFLEYLTKQFKDKKTVIDESARTSVHVHVNCAKLTLTQTYQFMLLYFVVEDLMAHVAGKDREGNLFCLRARDAEYIVDLLAAYARTRKFNPNPEQMRYSSLNICALTKFNSLEFRALRGTVDPDVICEWVDLILSLKDASQDYKTPDEIMGDFSKLGPDGFLRKVFPKHHKLFTQQKDYDALMWEGVRLVQEIAYATDWTVAQKPKRMFEVFDGEDDGR